MTRPSLPRELEEVGDQVLARAYAEVAQFPFLIRDFGDLLGARDKKRLARSVRVHAESQLYFRIITLPKASVEPGEFLRRIEPHLSMEELEVLLVSTASDLGILSSALDDDTIGELSAKAGPAFDRSLTRGLDALMGLIAEPIRQQGPGPR